VAVSSSGADPISSMMAMPTQQGVDHVSDTGINHPAVAGFD
jgi:hypothetical protein